MIWEDFNESPRSREILPKSYDLNEMKYKIESIFESKLKFDTICKRNQDQRQSMVQFIYHFFREQAERPNLIIQEAYNFLNGLKNHNSDADVILFTLILRNEIDEEFAEPHYQIKFRTEELLRYQLREDKSDISVKDLNQLVEKSKEAEIPLSLAARIINKMYKDDHPNKKVVLSHFGEIEEYSGEQEVKRERKKIKLKKFSTYNKRQKITPTKSKAQNKTNSISKFRLKNLEKNISYSKLEQTILITELKTHRIFLRFVKNEFKRLDPQSLGFIAKSKLKNLIANLYKDQESFPDEKDLLSQMDPEVKNITFSDIVGILSNETIDTQFEMISQLENIYEMKINK